ncbi:hypothetical protein BK634_11805 [Pseudomonas chlororaphis]|nr:hypothetical protein BK634_11805 [Pseudomonas chlororaphis]
MNEQNSRALSGNASTIKAWEELLHNEAALLENPGAHHKALLQSAHMLHQVHIIDRDGLSDLLEQADGALAYAVEALLDVTGTECEGAA